MTLARWHALTHALTLVAAATEQAYAAVPTANAETKQYAQDYAAALDSIRENLLRATRAAAPQGDA